MTEKTAGKIKSILTEDEYVSLALIVSQLGEASFKRRKLENWDKAWSAFGLDEDPFSEELFLIRMLTKIADSQHQ